MTNFTPAQWRMLDSTDAKKQIEHTIRDVQVQTAIASKGPIFQQLYMDGDLDSRVQTPFPGLYTADEYSDGHGLGSVLMDTQARAQFAQYQFDEQLVSESLRFAPGDNGGKDGKLWTNIVPLFLDYHIKSGHLRFLGMVVDTAFYEVVNEFWLTPTDPYDHVHLYSQDEKAGLKSKLPFTMQISRGEVFLVRRTAGKKKTFDVYSKKYVDACNRVNFGIFDQNYPTPVYNSNKGEFNQTLNAGMHGVDYEGAYNGLKSKSRMGKHSSAKSGGGGMKKLHVAPTALRKELQPDVQSPASGGSSSGGSSEGSGKQ